MTAAHGPHSAARGHLSQDEAAECAHDPQQAAADALTHLDACDACRDQVSALTEVTALLQDLPDVTMPDDIVARIEAAIGRESLAAAGLTTAPAGTATGTVGGLAAADPHVATGGRQRGSGRRRGRAVWGWLAGAAALAGVVVGVVNLGDGPTTQSPSASGAVNPAGPGPDAVHAAPDLQPGGAPAIGHTPVVPSMSGGYSSVQQWVEALIPTAGAALATRTATPVPAAAACTAHSPLSGERLVASGTASLNGTPAVLAVYADGNDTSAVTAVVFQAPCGTSNPTVLHEEVVPVG